MPYALRVFGWPLGKLEPIQGHATVATCRPFRVGAWQQRHTKIGTKSYLLHYMSIELGFKHRLGNSIFIGLRDRGCFAYWGGNPFSTSIKRSRIRRSWMGSRTVRTVESHWEKEDEGYLPWPTVPKENDESSWQKDLTQTVLKKRISAQTDSIKSVRPLRKMVTQLGRALCCEKGILWRSLDTRKNGWKRVLQSYQCRYSQEVLYLRQ